MDVLRSMLLFVLSASLLLGLCSVPTAQASEALDVFALPEDAISCPFTDVSESRWYYGAIAYCASTGLLQGVSSERYRPDGTLTLAEAVAVSVRIYETYHALPATQPAQPDEPWYQPYIECAQRYQLLPADLTDYAAPICRADAARIFALCLPEDELPQINSVRHIPGVQRDSVYADALYLLYRAGVLAGKDSFGSFDASSTLTRAELASIVAPLVNPNYRKRFSLTFPAMEAFSADAGSVKNPYRDVSENDWYYDAVMAQTCLGLMNGTGDGRFSPEETLTVRQTLALAVRVYEAYYGLAATSYTDAPAVARAYGICTTVFSDYDAPISRAEAAKIFYRCLPEGEFYALRAVSDIPDVDASLEPELYAVLHPLYTAGVLSGSDRYGSFQPDACFTRAEAARILSAITLPAQRATQPLEGTVSHMEVYGRSGSGRYPLQVYCLGSGENTLFLTYLVHGKGEIFDERGGADDGQAIYSLAWETLALLRSRYDLIDQGNWSIYLIPCVNPDGLFDGNDAYGTGRLTAFSYDDSGALVPIGIDINRSFPYHWQRFSRTEDRGCYYNGSSCYVTVDGALSLRSVESQALADFVSTHQGSGKNMIIDTHGFTNQILYTDSSSYVRRAFEANFPTHLPAYLSVGAGYMVNYFAHLSQYLPGAADFEGHLFEFAKYEVSVKNGVASILPYARHAYQTALLDILANAP